jgi:cobalt-zinc-cadmium efflux system membrane fusion protein
MALLGATPGCRQTEAAPQHGASSPSPNEVRLSPDQARAANIGVEPARQRELDDAIITSGRVTFDDMRVGHVFSPVTGRVVHIAAQLGQRVKRGAPLATVESPEIGDAVSDANKAQAELIAAEHDYRRQRALLAEHATSDAAFEQSQQLKICPAKARVFQLPSRLDALAPAAFVRGAPSGAS